jgi:RNA polymerase-binding transcription factor DksA
MDPKTLNDLRDRLHRERRDLITAGNAWPPAPIPDPPELEEHAQAERDADAREEISKEVQARIGAIDAALARMDAGRYGTCASCGKEIFEARLRAEPNLVLCANCAQAPGEVATNPAAAEESTVASGASGLPPDLDMLDDQELAENLRELIREDGRIDTHELSIGARSGVIYLEGALPSEPEHQILLNVLTDVAGVREIVDHLEIRRLAWERSDRSKAEDAEDVPAGDLHRREPYGGTEDINLSEEGGVNYEPPENPPPPPHRKD